MDQITITVCPGSLHEPRVAPGRHNVNSNGAPLTWPVLKEAGQVSTASDSPSIISTGRDDGSNMLAIIKRLKY